MQDKYFATRFRTENKRIEADELTNRSGRAN